MFVGVLHFAAGRQEVVSVENFVFAAELVHFEVQEVVVPDDVVGGIVDVVVVVLPVVVQEKYYKVLVVEETLVGYDYEVAYIVAAPFVVVEVVVVPVVEGWESSFADVAEEVKDGPVIAVAVDCMAHYAC